MAKAVSVFTVAHLIDNFDAVLLAEVRAGIKQPTTRDTYLYPFKHLRKIAGEMPAADLRFEHLGGRYPHTHHTVRALKSLYAWAVEEEMIPKNPFARVRIPDSGYRTRVLTPGEFARLLAACSPRYRRFLVCLARTMARPGELRLVRWGDVHLDRDLDGGGKGGIILLHEFKAKKRRRKDRPTVRQIPLDPFVLRLMRLWKNRRSPGPKDYVFPAAADRPGEPITYSAIHSAFKRARTRSGLRDFGEPVVLYTLRHTGATRAIRAGIPESIVREMLGHVDTRMTARYVHLGEQDVMRASNQLYRRPRLRIADVG